MHSEQRKEIRFNLTGQQKGKLQVLLDDQCLDVSAVKDMSPMGIRVQVGTLVGIGQNIQVRYLSQAVDLKLNGTVVWNSSSADDFEGMEEPDAYIIGIKLASPSLLHAFW